jgi:hypothetical protein
MVSLYLLKQLICDDLPTVFSARCFSETPALPRWRHLHCLIERRPIPCTRNGQLYLILGSAIDFRGRWSQLLLREGKFDPGALQRCYTVTAKKKSESKPKSYLKRTSWWITKEHTWARRWILVGLPVHITRADSNWQKPWGSRVQPARPSSR